MGRQLYRIRNVDSLGSRALRNCDRPRHLERALDVRNGRNKPPLLSTNFSYSREEQFISAEERLIGQSLERPRASEAVPDRRLGPNWTESD